MSENGDNYGNNQQTEDPYIEFNEQFLDNLSKSQEIEDEEVEYELTEDADDARAWDIDSVNLEEEEAIIAGKLENGRYIDGDDVAAIHQKYEKLMDEAKREAKAKQQELEDEAKKNKTDIDPDELNKITKELEQTNKELKERRNKEVEELCEKAPKYNKIARNMLRKKQLRDNERERGGREIKIYRKDKKHNGLLVTTYGKNRVGELNKFLRKDSDRAAKLRGDKAKRHGDKLGYATKDFMQGDAEHMFKGSVAMTMHAFLYLLNKLFQAGNKTAQGILYLYAVHKLNMDDAEALQKALDDTGNGKMGLTMENGPKGDGPITGVPSLVEGGGAPSIGNQVRFEMGQLEPFECKGQQMIYDAKNDVVIVPFTFENGRAVDPVFVGTEENLRKLFEDMGKSPEEIEEALAKNAEAVRDHNLDEFMVNDVKQAFLDIEAEKNKEGFTGPVMTPSEEDLSVIMGIEQTVSNDAEATNEIGDVDSLLTEGERDENLGDKVEESNIDFDNADSSDLDIDN